MFCVSEKRKKRRRPLAKDAEAQRKRKGEL
jgi:hypothetical protein